MRKQITEFLHFLLAINGVFMAWKAVSLAVHSPYPILVVISESMAPAFHRGDIIILWNRVPRIEAGDIPVVWFADQELPMVHRAIEIHWHLEGDEASQMILTKGDNNAVDDRSLYPKGRDYARREEVFGLVRGLIPLLGWPAIWFRETVQRMWNVSTTKLASSAFLQ